MKSKYLHLVRGSCFFALLAILGFTFISISTVSAQATVISAQSEVITTDALTGTGWKSIEDYSAIISAERINAAQALAAPDLTDAQVALYTGYDRMLVYMQADLAVKLPVEPIAETNFKKVKLEAPSDPVLVNLQESEFTALYATLLIKLVL